MSMNDSSLTVLTPSIYLAHKSYLMYLVPLPGISYDGYSSTYSCTILRGNSSVTQHNGGGGGLVGGSDFLEKSITKMYGSTLLAL